MVVMAKRHTLGPPSLVCTLAGGMRLGLLVFMTCCLALVLLIRISLSLVLLIRRSLTLPQVQSGEQLVDNAVCLFLTRCTGVSTTAKRVLPALGTGAAPAKTAPPRTKPVPAAAPARASVDVDAR